MSDDLTIKKQPQGVQTTPGEGHKIKMPGLHNRVAKATAQGQALEEGASRMPNRLGLLLDVSGSMGSPAEYNHNLVGKSKIDHLKEALQGFYQACDFQTTACCYETFG